MFLFVQTTLFSASHLINSCGLSPETAVYLSKKMHFETPQRPDSVITLLRSHGFADTHISKLASLLPSVLLSIPEKTLLHKPEFLYSVGLSGAGEARIVSSIPNIFHMSLAKNLIPIYNFLKSLVILMANEKRAFKNRYWLSRNMGKTIPRCSLVKTLLLKGLVKKVLCFSMFFMLNEGDFLDKYVIKYQEYIPRLLDVYQGKMSFLELGFESEEKCGMKRL